MLRMVAKMSMSSDVLDTHSTSTTGPGDLGVLGERRASSNEMPVRSTLPAACDGADELTPACDGGLAGVGRSRLSLRRRGDELALRLAARVLLPRRWP